MASTRHSIRLSDAFPAISYELKVSSRRRTLSIEIKQGQVTVKSPLQVPQEQIEEFLRLKQGWLTAKLAIHASMPKQTMHFQNGDCFLLRGKLHEFRLVKGTRFESILDPQAKVLKFVLPQGLKDQKQYIQNKFKSFIKAQCQAYVETHIDQYINRTQLRPKGIEYKFYKSRWGCCYRNGLIRINPWLVAAPSQIIDCVLVHELCHLRHLNHSAAFWQLNDLHCGRCAQADAWLRQNGHLAMVDCT